MKLSKGSSSTWRQQHGSDGIQLLPQVSLSFFPLPPLSSKTMRCQLYHLLLFKKPKITRLDECRILKKMKIKQGEIVSRVYRYMEDAGFVRENFWLTQRRCELLTCVLTTSYVVIGARLKKRVSYQRCVFLLLLTQ